MEGQHRKELIEKIGILDFSVLNKTIDNITKVLEKCKQSHEENSNKWSKVYNYYKNPEALIKDKEKLTKTISIVTDLKLEATNMAMDKMIKKHGLDAIKSFLDISELMKQRPNMIEELKKNWGYV